MLEKLFCIKCQTMYCVFFFASPRMHKKTPKKQNKKKNKN